MKKLLILICYISFCFPAFTQWTGTGSSTYLTNPNGAVGMGITNPSAVMHIFSGLQYPRYTVQSTQTNGAPGYSIGNSSSAYVWTMHYDISSDFMGFFREGLGNTMIIKSSGNVGIGTLNPGSFKLAVEGKIGAKEIKVTNTNPWPDYVFEDNYQLTSIDDLSQYIKRHKHLPGIPSAREIEEEGGVELGKLNAKLLEKIEELTLYVIELKKQNDRLADALKLGK